MFFEVIELEIEDYLVKISDSTPPSGAPKLAKCPAFKAGHL